MVGAVLRCGVERGNKMSDESLEESFEAVKAKVHENLVQARKLILEANEAASKAGMSLFGVDADAANDLQSELNDAGLVPECEQEHAWSSSDCW